MSWYISQRLLVVIECPKTYSTLDNTIVTLDIVHVYQLHGMVALDISLVSNHQPPKSAQPWS